jgi:hypothetical protein
MGAGSVRNPWQRMLWGLRLLCVHARVPLCQQWPAKMIRQGRHPFLMRATLQLTLAKHWQCCQLDEVQR